LVGDLKSANKLAKKAPKKKPVSTATKAKKATPIVSTKRKASTKARRPAKTIVQQEVVAPIGGEVVLGIAEAKTSIRTIVLP